MHESGCGPKPKWSNVRFCAAIGDKRTSSAPHWTDIKRASLDRPNFMSTRPTRNTVASANSGATRRRRSPRHGTWSWSRATDAWRAAKRDRREAPIHVPQLQVVSDRSCQPPGRGCDMNREGGLIGTCFRPSYLTSRPRDSRNHTFSPPLQRLAARAAPGGQSRGNRYHERHAPADRASPDLSILDR